MSPPFYRGCWHEVSRDLFFEYSHYLPQKKDLTGCSPFLFHAVLLDQAFAHCPIFLTAALKSLDLIPVPMWLIILSDQLRIFGLVSHYPTNYLILMQALPIAINLYYWGLRDPKLIPYLTELRTKFLHFTHPDATQTKVCVRLACVRHTASVHSEPESNSNM